jgi:hypothetical protein
MTNTQYEQRVFDGVNDHVVRVDESRHWFSPGRVIGGLLGLVLAFVGAVTLFKTGVGSDLTAPTVTVFGMVNSAAVGLIELAAGLLFVLFALSEDGRSLIGFLGVVAIIAGIIGLVASPQLRQDLGFDTNTAWFITVCGIVALIAAAIPSVFRGRRTVREVDAPVAVRQY